MPSPSSLKVVLAVGVLAPIPISEIVTASIVIYMNILEINMKLKDKAIFLMKINVKPQKITFRVKRIARLKENQYIHGISMQNHRKTHIPFETQK